MLQLTVMYPLRVSSVAVYGGHGEAVKLCVSHSFLSVINKRRLLMLDVCSQRP